MQHKLLKWSRIWPKKLSKLLFTDGIAGIAGRGAGLKSAVKNLFGKLLHFLMVSHSAYTEKKDVIDSIKSGHWIFFNCIN